METLYHGYLIFSEFWNIHEALSDNCWYAGHTLDIAVRNAVPLSPWPRSMHNQQCSITMRHKTRCAPFMNAPRSHPVGTLTHIDTDLLFCEASKSAKITQKFVHTSMAYWLTEDEDIGRGLILGAGSGSGFPNHDVQTAMGPAQSHFQWELGARSSGVRLSECQAHRTYFPSSFV
jgi:hypothetical protein